MKEKKAKLTIRGALEDHGTNPKEEYASRSNEGLYEANKKVTKHGHVCHNI